MRGSSSDFMQRVWRNLPSDVLEKVLTFLPIPSLCRFRSVSKEWNRRICHRDFASRHAEASCREEYALVALQFHPHFNSTGGWEVLDVANKTSFTLSDDFLAEFVKQERVSHCTHPGIWERSIMAADGGLLCLLYCFRHRRQSACDQVLHETILVCNPVLRTVKQLPPCEGWVAGWDDPFPKAVISTDTISMEYEIVFVNFADVDLLPNTLHIYNSKTASWTESSMVPRRLDALPIFICTYPVLVLLKDDVFSLTLHELGGLARLVSYNKATGTVSDLGIDVPGVDNKYFVGFQLVVSKGRLFCVTMKFGVNAVRRKSSIAIAEFILERKEYVQVSVLRSNLLNWILGDNVGDVVFVQDVWADVSAPAIAIGLANSILICSFAGRSVEYNLSNGTWVKYPDCKFVKDHRLHDSLVLFGSSQCLSFCAP